MVSTPKRVNVRTCAGKLAVNVFSVGLVPRSHASAASVENDSAFNSIHGEYGTDVIRRWLILSYQQ